MSAQRLNIVYEYRTLGAGAVLKGVRVLLEKYGMPLTGVKVDGQEFNLAQIPRDIDQIKPNGFDLIASGIDISCGSVGNHHLDFIGIKSASVPPIPLDQWIVEFSTNQHFIMAWVVDVEYDRWQNAEDPLEYSAAGRSYAHFPMKSNGLPYPLERLIIDISGNRGQWTFRDGYIEAVGAVMWLGESFWPLSGANRERVANSSWLKVSRLSSSVTRIQSSEHCFATAEGAIGELQTRLRSLLYQREEM